MRFYKKALQGRVESMQQSSATPSLVFGGCRRLLYALNLTLQCLLVSIAFGPVSSLHLTSDFYTCKYTVGRLEKWGEPLLWVHPVEKSVCVSSETSVLRSWCTRSFGAGEEVWFSVSGVVVTGGILSLRGQYRDEGKGGGGGGGGRGREEGEGGGGGKGGGEDGTGVSGSDNGRKKLKVKKQKETHRKRKRESEG